MVNWIDDLSAWDGSLSAVLVAAGLAPARQEAKLQALAGRALHLPPAAVLIARERDHAPRVLEPAGSGLWLSTSHRAPFTALAVAGSPAGVDVEVVDRGEIPWNVLHPDERAALAALEGDRQSHVFARLWSVKEAYLKARGVGLTREPSSFVVTLVDEERARIDDRGAPRAVQAATTWRRMDASVGAISVVVLDQPGGG